MLSPLVCLVSTGCCVVVIYNSCDWLRLLQHMVIVCWQLNRWISQNVVGKKSPKQHDVDNPHNDYGRHQNTEVER